MGKKISLACSDLNKLNEGQAGSRPGRNSIDVVIQKEMKYLYATVARTGLERRKKLLRQNYVQPGYDVITILWNIKEGSINAGGNITTHVL
jgi:hypothetical protein